MTSFKVVSDRRRFSQASLFAVLVVDQKIKRNWKAVITNPEFYYWVFEGLYTQISYFDDESTESNRSRGYSLFEGLCTQ